MITPVIVGPVILPELPDPSPSECQTMLNYANKLITSLESVSAKLDAASTNPDEGLILIRNHIDAMLSDARTLKRKLSSIKSEASRKADLASQGAAML